MRKINFKDKRGEGHLSTAVKILIAVVIGALLLSGLYVLFAGESGVLASIQKQVQGLMDFGEAGVTVERVLDEESGTYCLRYSYDGQHWQQAKMPDYGTGSSVYGLISNHSESDLIQAALVKNGDQFYVLTSPDGGVSWVEQVSFTAIEITHFYYGASTPLPPGSSSFSGERFVCRYRTSGSTYFTMTSNGKTWTKPTWSDMHIIGS